MYRVVSCVTRKHISVNILLCLQDGHDLVSPLATYAPPTSGLSHLALAEAPAHHQHAHLQLYSTLIQPSPEQCGWSVTCVCTSSGCRTATAGKLRDVGWQEAAEDRVRAIAIWYPALDLIPHGRDLGPSRILAGASADSLRYYIVVRSRSDIHVFYFLMLSYVPISALLESHERDKLENLGYLPCE